MRAAALPLSFDDCRRTLRRLELEAYASLVSVLRAQGALGAERRRLLETIRAALHIGHDRHCAEARRVSNDELLAAIAEQLSGPNTGLGWVKEGRRKVPIMPRGIPQTLYTAIADGAALTAIEENETIARRESQTGRPGSPTDVSEEESIPAESMDEYNFKSRKGDIANHPPIVMCDQSLKMLNDDGPPRKKSRSDAPVAPHRISHQKHPNLSQIYTSYSKPHTGKISSQYGRNSYNQSGKIGMKSNHANLSKSSISKHRSVQKHGANAKHCGQATVPHHRVRSGIKSPTDPHMAGSQALGLQAQMDSSSMKSQTPTYQANYTMPTVQNVGLDDSNSDIKLPIGTTIPLESPSTQLLTQPPLSQRAFLPATQVTDEASIASPSVRGSLTTSVVGSGIVSTPKMQQKSCHFIIKKKSDNLMDGQQPQKIQVGGKQTLSKQDLGNIKVLQNRQLVVTPTSNNSQKIINSSGKLITTKIVQHIPHMPQAQMNSNLLSQPHAPNTQVIDKVLIVPKTTIATTMQSSVVQRSLGSNASLKNIFLSAHSPVNPIKDGDASTLSIKSNEGDVLSKSVILNNLNNSDVKLSTTTFLLNSKSGQKMVVLPAKQRPQQLTSPAMPVLQVKGMQGKTATMKLVPVSGQAVNNQSKPSNVTVLSKAVNTNVLGMTAKIISKDSLNQLKSGTFNSDSPISKVFSQVQIATKGAQQSMKHSSGKGNVIVVQKGNSLSKNPLLFAKSTTDRINKIVSESHQSIASVSPPNDSFSNISHGDSGLIEKIPSSVVLLDLANEHLQRTDDLADEYLESEESEGTIMQSNIEVKSESLITEDTPILFHNQISDECTADSMESTTDSLMEVQIDDSAKSVESYCEVEDIDTSNKIEDRVLTHRITSMTNFADWETDLVNAAEKQHSSEKISDLNLELEMSSDSETEGYATNRGVGKELSQDESQDEQEDTNEMFVQHSSISQASRTLLSQLQDDGSSSNDSPFVLTKNLDTARLELLDSSQTSSSAME